MRGIAEGLDTLRVTRGEGEFQGVEEGLALGRGRGLPAPRPACYRAELHHLTAPPEGRTIQCMSTHERTEATTEATNEAGRREGPPAITRSADDPRATATPDTATEAETVTALTALDFRIDASLRYHQKRRDFFERWDRLIRAASAFAGTGAAALLFSQTTNDTKLAVGVVLALASVVAAVWNPGDAARLNIRQHARYSEIAERVARRRTKADSDEVADWDASLIAIEADEPPLRNYLWAQCWNEHAMSIGSREPFYVLDRYQRIARHFVEGDVTQIARAA